MSAARVRVLALCAIALMLAAACGSSATTSTPSSPLVDIGAGLQGPPGLHAAVFAEASAHVAALAYDGSGRLWVATAGYEDVGDDGIYVIDDAGGSARPVLSDLHTPLGLLWIGDELYVSSKERVDAYSGFDGTAFAEHRTVVTFPAGVGELNGLAQSPDGRIVLGISAPCDSCVPSSPWSGSVVSFLPDGSDVRIEASGIRAPVGLAYLPGASDLYVTMNQRDDLGDATPGDWLGLVRMGQQWGFPACYGQGGAACADAPGPVAVLDPHAAVSGIVIVTGELGDAIGTSALVAEWATGLVQQVPLSPSAESGQQATARPFISGVKNPVALARTPDGAVLVGDWTTGVVYRISPA